MSKTESLYKQYKSILSSHPKGIMNKASLIVTNLNGDTSKAMTYISNFTEEELKVIFEYKSKMIENRKYSIDDDRVLMNMLKNQGKDYDYLSSLLNKSPSSVKRRCFQLKNMFDLMKKRKENEEELNLFFKKNRFSRKTTDEYSNNTAFDTKDTKQRQRLLKNKRELKKNQSIIILINSFLSIYDYLMTIIDENSSILFNMNSSHVDINIIIEIKERLLNAKKNILESKLNDDQQENIRINHYILDNLKLIMSFLKLNLIIKKRKEEESV